MNIYRINTTAFSEEDFVIETTLTKSQIKSIIKPIVLAERNGYSDYDNDGLIDALIEAYPGELVAYKKSEEKYITI